MIRRFIPLLLLPGLLLAAEADKLGINTGPKMVSTAGYLEAIAGLLLVLALIVGLGWAVKRMGITPSTKGSVRVIGGVSLGGRERALLLEAEGKRVLVGVSPGQVRPLMRLDDATSETTAAGDAGAEDFPRQLQQEQERRNAGKGQPEEQPS